MISFKFCEMLFLNNLPIFSLEAIWILMFAVILLLLLSVFNRNVFLFFIIVLLLTLPSSININIRFLIQIVSFFLLLYFFIKKYGLEFTKYPKLPGIWVTFFFLLFTSMLVAMTFSVYHFLGFQQIFRVIIFFLIVYFIFSLIENQQDLRILIYALISVGVIYSTFIFNEFANNNFSIIEANLSQFDKLRGNIINMNSFGAFFVIVISLIFSFMTTKRTKLFKWISIFLLGIFFSGLFLTNSRAAILAVIFSTLFIFYNLNKKVFKGLIYFILFVVLLLFLIEPINEFFSIYFRLDKLSTGRDLILGVVFNVIKNNITFGVGPAATKYSIYSNLNFLIGSPEENLLAFHYNQIEFGHAHNFFLFFWSDLGLLGLFTSIFLPIVFFYLCYKSLKRLKSQNSDYYVLSIGITAAGIGMFIRAIFEWGNIISYGTINLDLPFWIMVCIITYLHEVSTRVTIGSDIQIRYSSRLLNERLTI